MEEDMRKTMAGEESPLSEEDMKSMTKFSAVLGEDTSTS
jgi:hypothetical protein